MNVALVSALLGMLAGLLSGALSGWFAMKRLSKETENRVLSELYSKKLDAYEELWSTFLGASQHGRRNSIISEKNGEAYLDTTRARAYVDNMNDFHASRRGIYLSAKLSNLMFRTNQNIEEAIEGNVEAAISMSNTKRDKILGGFSLIKEAIRKDLHLKSVDPATDIFTEN